MSSILTNNFLQGIYTHICAMFTFKTKLIVTSYDIFLKAIQQDTVLESILARASRVLQFFSSLFSS